MPNDEPNHPKIPVLDLGYIRVIESWGSDERIIEAARQSTQKGFLGWGHDCTTCNGTGQAPVTDERYATYECPLACEDCKGFGFIKGDERLLRYLWKHKHSTPFEFAGLIIEVQAPIAVFREWHRF